MSSYGYIYLRSRLETLPNYPGIQGARPKGMIAEIPGERKSEREIIILRDYRGNLVLHNDFFTERNVRVG